MSDRRKFIKQTLLSGVGLSMGGYALANSSVEKGSHGKIKLFDIPQLVATPPDIPFVPHRVARWWIDLEDLQWSQKSIRDKIKRRAEAFAEAKIDTAINGGCHIRFDFSNYFGQLHGYLANVCEELHKHGIKYIDHYSCNHVQRPRDEQEFHKLHRNHRHHVLLFHDPIAAKHAQYEGHRFQDICEVDVRDGSRGYAAQYQMEAFCHNNPGFLDMHVKYLKRLLAEVPIDAIEVDDMCDYVGLAACGCKYCRERFKRDYDREIPPFGDKSFWGDTSGAMAYWGNYDNPAFRDFIRMKADSIADHVKLVKNTVGKLPLLTCTSSTGPISLNVISLNLERMSPYLDFFMLENVGATVRSTNWVRMDAEALHQKDIAMQRGNAPAIALSSTIYEKGAYLGWALSRFWGVANWSNLLNRRLEEEPPNAREMAEVIHEWNNWEVDNSDLDYRKGEDLVEVRLVSNSYCRDNGWRDKEGKEHWTRLRAWSESLVNHNVGYRFVRAGELGDATMLKRESTPLVLDGVACVSDKQCKALSDYLASGGKAWLALPFGTHDEKGFEREEPLSEQLLKAHGKRITLIESAIHSDPLEGLIAAKKFSPVIRQTAGDKRWAARIRFYDGEFTLHFLNRAMEAIPHPGIEDSRGAVIQDIESLITDNRLSYEIRMDALPHSRYVLRSPELKDKSREVISGKGKKGYQHLKVDLTGINVYSIIQKG